ncbi:MAG: hypothetical protein ABIY70_14910 [Capsulimonas sp.]|uniref:hypothetical protein n=1 Tax=Capsulimonas sp. TaxID=2494211 RepID=UPI0032650BC6
MTYRISPSLVLAPIAVLALSISPVPARAQSITIPDGWTQKAAPSGATVFIPGDLAPGQSYSVTVFSPDDLKGRSPENWLSSRAHKDTSAPGLPAKIEGIVHEAHKVEAFGFGNAFAKRQVPTRIAFTDRRTGFLVRTYKFLATIAMVK